MASKALLPTPLLLTLTLLSFITVRSSARTPLHTPRPAPMSPAIAPSVPPPTHSPSPSPPPPTSSPSPPPARCPVDFLKLSVCANVLNLVDILIGPQGTQCCRLINGLVNLDAAVCLCTAIKANVLGLVVDVPGAVSLILNRCGKDNSGFICN